MRRTMALSILMAATLPGIAQAHTSDELEAWRTSWQHRAEAGLTTDLVAEYREMDRRHRLAPQIESSSLSGPDWSGLVRAHFPESELATALRVIECESQGNKTARNPSSGAAGLFQIMPFWARHFGIAYEALFAAEINVEIARKVWDQQGWGAWVCY